MVAQDLAEAVGTGVQLDVNQLCYNLLSRAIEFEILPACRQQQISVTTYMPLLQGLLADKYRTPDEVPAFRARTRHFRGDRPGSRHGEPGAEAETFAALAAIREIAQELGKPMDGVALAWVLAKPGVTGVLAGARTPEQVARNVRSAQLSLSTEATRSPGSGHRCAETQTGPERRLFPGRRQLPDPVTARRTTCLAWTAHSLSATRCA